ncbi:MAG: glycoside hydrolase family 5 protein [Bacilli bacterium]|nr:glycoside hydrolase family 5 protein [Bacilli bacterium]
MKINIFKLCVVIICSLLILFVTSCEDELTPPIEECAHTECTWEWEEDAKCNQNNIMNYVCNKCGKIVDSKEAFKDHELVEEVEEATCTEKGSIHITCKNCSYVVNKKTDALGHDYKYVIDEEATDEQYGYRHKECTRCDDKGGRIAYVNNGFSSHGQLKVSGINLVDQNGDLMRLVGVSTHGLQWAGKYVNLSTFENMRNEFGINVMRLALYTGERGYCTSTPERAEELYQLVVDGINYCTALDMYVIVDWHMLGADTTVDGDENPLYYKNEAIAFFDRITKEFIDHQNILFEIMNEPSGDTTWADCKEYANAVIPVIRKNMPKAVVLVGNPKWSADLVSVAKDPLGFTNIMYTFHFYAADNTETGKIVTAIKAKLPVFISEHGGMDADGDGEMNYNSLKKWYEVIDKYNLSFVAWNLSNTKGSASMFKTTTSTLDNFSDELLKEWGVYYKQRVREVVGLPTTK